MEKPMFEREELLYDLALAQASFVVANLAPSAALLHDGDADGYYKDVVKSTLTVMDMMLKLTLDDERGPKIINTGLEIVGKRAQAEVDAA